MIDGIGKGTAASPARATAVERTGAVPRAATRTPGEARVTGSLYADLAAAAGPPFDAERVREISAAIAEGRYRIDPERVAAAMLALDLPAKAGR